ncbi:hypothetical protein LJR098_003357 [Rhizobium sp. LjRoot98]|uniref:hypothetical protein n=1 Tax=Rhizobium sp. LjRoot98 TaxID=3342345 RepID=UPI003ED14622
MTTDGAGITGINYVDATCRRPLGGHPGWVEFGALRTDINLPTFGRTEAKQYLYFTSQEVRSLRESELTGDHLIVVPLPEGCLWDEIWDSLFVCSLRQLPAFTATLISGREKIEGRGGRVQTLKQSFVEIQTSLHLAMSHSIHDEQAHRSNAMINVSAAIEDFLLWLEENRHIDIRGWALRLSEDGIEISGRLNIRHDCFHHIELGHDCKIEDVIRAIYDHRVSLEQHLFYLMAKREHPDDYSFSDRLEADCLAA